MHSNRKIVFVRILNRVISTSASASAKNIPNKAKGHSSNQWLTRQFKDPFVELARTKNYRYYHSRFSSHI